MDRRALLGHLGAAGTLGAAAFAGCLGGVDAPGDSPGTDTADTTSTPDDPVTDTDTETETSDGNTTDDSTPVPDDADAVIGDRSSVAFAEMNRPHPVTFENATDGSVTLDLSVAAEGRGAVWARTVELAPAGSFELRLAEPAHYTVEVRRTGGGSDGDPGATVDVPLSLFDCNYTGTTVEVTADGVDATTFTTELACPAPELVDTSFDAGEGACGTPTDAADVRYDGEAVRVTGTVSMPDPCRSVSLSEATYDDGKSTLFLTVQVAAADPAATCVACVGISDYEVVADFDVDLPDRVVVRHAGADRATEVVARAVRGGDAGA